MVRVARSLVVCVVFNRSLVVLSSFVPCISLSFFVGYLHDFLFYCRNKISIFTYHSISYCIMLLPFTHTNDVLFRLYPQPFMSWRIVVSNIFSYYVSLRSEFYVVVFATIFTTTKRCFVRLYPPVVSVHILFVFVLLRIVVSYLSDIF